MLEVTLGVCAGAVVLLVHAPALAAAAKPPPTAKALSMVDTRTIQVEHVTIGSTRSFGEVRRALESSLPHVDEGLFALLRFRQTEAALRAMEAAPSLSIFGMRDHGALLQIAGQDRHAVQYDIGNPLTASRMTRLKLSAALYAPVRVLLREDEHGATAFEYDRPTTTFGQFDDADLRAVAAHLDDELRQALEAAAA